MLACALTGLSPTLANPAAISDIILCIALQYCHLPSGYKAEYTQLSGNIECDRKFHVAMQYLLYANLFMISKDRILDIVACMQLHQGP
jgi:hypothetical protein